MDRAYMGSIINFRIVFKVISSILFIISVGLLLCALIGYFYSEKIFPFIFSSVIAIIFGIVFHFFGEQKKEGEAILQKEAYLTVALSWLLISFFGCLPYVFSGAIPSFVNAFFESVSGFTTTGSSILTDIESLPKSILFWRSLTHWIGGIGIIVLVIVVMPTFKIGGYHIFTLESSLQEKIQPRTKAVGKRLLIIYVLLTVAETLLLLIGNMNLFESICHAFGTIATGGFSPKNTSIGEYSPYIQYVVMIFMLLSGTNFVIHYYLLNRNIKKVKENDELKFYLSVIIITGVVITSTLVFKMHKPFSESFREGFFQVISIVTTTGYATADYMQWPAYAWIIIFFALFFGGSTGSTSGGIKMARHVVLVKNFSRIFKKLIYPHAVIPIRLNRNTINSETNNSILSFIAIYFLIFAIGSSLLIILGVEGKTASSSVATCMAGIGPGIAEVGPAGNFANIPSAGKLILSFLMLVGRLEIYTILVLFTGNFWKN